MHVGARSLDFGGHHGVKSECDLVRKFMNYFVKICTVVTLDTPQYFTVAAFIRHHNANIVPFVATPCTQILEISVYYGRDDFLVCWRAAQGLRQLCLIVRVEAPSVPLGDLECFGDVIGAVIATFPMQDLFARRLRRLCAVPERVPLLLGHDTVSVAFFPRRTVTIVMRKGNAVGTSLVFEAFIIKSYHVHSP